MSEIRVKIPSGNDAERRYIVSILLEHFLGLKIDVQTHEQGFYQLERNQRAIRIKDQFFSSLDNELSYIEERNIPSKVQFVDDWSEERKLPVIHGTDRISKSSGNLETDFDIFASAFFMLTRWEEIAVPARDKHGRFDGKASLAFKEGFIDLPVVDYYAELLREWIQEILEINIPGHRKFRLFLTHDVDSPHLWKSGKNLLQQTYLNVLKRGEVGQVFKDIGTFSKRKRKGDPWDSFSYLMDLAEQVGSRSHFYFIPDGKYPHETHYNLNDPFIQRLAEEIKRRDHVIGIHPSYDTYNDGKMLKEQVEKLKRAFDLENIKYGRQHYLRFNTPETWQFWEDAGLSYDSSLYYAEAPGYRCGTCKAYPVFNVKTRKQLRLMEIPLVFMEQSFIGYQNGTVSQMKKYLKRTLDQVYSVKGDFMYLWHNSSFYTPEFKPYEKVPEQFINWVKEITDE